MHPQTVLKPLALLAAVASSSALNVTQTVTAGTATFVGATSSGVVSWLGIPYAAAPTGTLRFAPPAAPTTTGTYASTSYGAECPQSSGGGGGSGGPPSGTSGGPSTNSTLGRRQSTTSSTSMDEDCLFLNIYTPANATAELPVFLWIHGGGATGGSGNEYDGTTLINQSPNPIVVVTINYRLGVLGWLAGSDMLAINGTNLGMLDQRQAIKWTKQYIANFGGNPDKITIGGQSQGGMSVGTHLVAYDGKQDYFAQAVMESGSSLSGPVLVADGAPAQSIYDGVVSYAGCSESTASARISCLRALNYSQLLTAQTSYLDSISTVGGVFYATVDGSFLLRNPAESLGSGLVSPVPILIGSNTNEGEGLAGSWSNLTAFWEAINVLDFTTTTFVSSMVSLWTPYAEATSESVACQHAYTYWQFLCPAFQLSQTYGSSSANPVYRYWFNASTAEHGDEVDYVWGNKGSDALGVAMVKFWTNFVATGSPNGDSSTESWPRYYKSSDGSVILLNDVGAASTFSTFADSSIPFNVTTTGSIVNFCNAIHPITTDSSTASATTDLSSNDIDSRFTHTLLFVLAALFF
ncbi:hypothetical protein HDU82_001025 [Entophlyctis luteolus]|nr:hypothetical protein HDU82_001025 [Entophlyctis luteolus]